MDKVLKMTIELAELSNHLKVSIAQTANGARVSVTVDREDHNIDEAVKQSVLLYKKTIRKLVSNGIKVEN